MDKRLFSVSEAAKQTRLSEHTNRRELSNGTISGSKVSRDWVLDSEEVERLAKEFPLSPELRVSA